MLRGYRVVSSPVQVTSTKTCIVLSSFYRLDGCYVLVEKPDFSSFCARGKGVHHTIKDDGEGKLGMTGSIKLGQVKWAWLEKNEKMCFTEVIDFGDRHGA